MMTVGMKMIMLKWEDLVVVIGSVRNYLLMYLSGESTVWEHKEGTDFFFFFEVFGGQPVIQTCLEMCLDEISERKYQMRSWVCGLELSKGVWA